MHPRRTAGKDVGIEAVTADQDIVAIPAMDRIGGIATAQIVVAGRAIEVINPRTAIHGIGAVFAKQAVVAFESNQVIVPPPADQQVFTAIAIDLVIEIVADPERIFGHCGKKQVFDVGIEVEAGGGVDSIESTARTGVLNDQVFLPVHIVDVVAGTASEQVRSGSGIELVVAGAARKAVVASFPDQTVVGRAASDCVGAFPAVRASRAGIAQRERRIGKDQRIIERRTDHRHDSFEIADRAAGIGTGGTGQGGRHVTRYSGLRAGEIKQNLVEAAAASGTVPVADPDQIVSGLAKNRIDLASCPR